jgi:hypothetical protein
MNPGPFSRQALEIVINALIIGLRIQGIIFTFN